PPRIAAHLGRYPQTVRKALHDFQQRGPQAFDPDRPGPAPDAARRDRILGLLRDLLGQDRTWTSAQLAEALQPHGVTVGGRQVRRYLGLPKAGCRRTASTLAHKQDPAKVERAKVVLGGVKKSPGRSVKALLSGRERLRPVPADRLQLVPAGPAEASEVRVPA